MTKDDFDLISIISIILIVIIGIIQLFIVMIKSPLALIIYFGIVYIISRIGYYYCCKKDNKNKSKSNDEKTD